MVALAGLAAPTWATVQADWSQWWLQHEPEFLWGNEPWSVDHTQLFTGREPPPALVTGVGNGQPPTWVQHSRRGAVLRRGFVYTHVVPGLEALTEDHDPNMRAAAVYALGISVEPRFATRLGATLRERLRDRDPEVKRSALVALGQLDDPDTAADLLEIARDTKRGRRLLGGDRVPDGLRAAAIEGLGYAAEEALVPELLALFDETPENEAGLRGTMIAALGVGSGDRAPQVARHLSAMLPDYWLDKRVKQTIPMALAHLGDPRSVDALLELLADDDVDARLRVAGVRALGGLATADHDAAVEHLLERAFEDKDPNTRRYALTGLFRTLARDTEVFDNSINHYVSTKALTAQLVHPRHRNDQTFMALAAGIYLRAHPSRAGYLRAQLEHAVVDNKDPVHRGAYLIALGLARNETFGPELLELFRDQKPNQGEAALALGLFGYKPARDELYELLLGHATAPFTQLGVALMLLDDERAAPVLLEMLRESGNLEERATLAVALGYHRTEAVARALLERAQDLRLDKLTRVAACRALGDVCAVDQLPLAREWPSIWAGSGSGVGRPTTAIVGGGARITPPMLLWPTTWSSIYSTDKARTPRGASVRGSSGRR